MTIPDIVVKTSISIIGFLLVLVLHNLFDKVDKVYINVEKRYSSISKNQDKLENNLEKRMGKIEDYLFFNLEDRRKK